MGSSFSEPRIDSEAIPIWPANTDHWDHSATGGLSTEEKVCGLMTAFC